MSIDRREFSQQAYAALYELKTNLAQLAKAVLIKDLEKRSGPTRQPTATEIAEKAKSYGEKSSSLVQGLSVYISTWGLHRLTGDAKKFSLGTASDTQYKGAVYGLFLQKLKDLSEEDFVLWSESTDISDEQSLVTMDFRKYTALNRLAMQVAKEWSFWAPSILDEAKED